MAPLYNLRRYSDSSDSSSYTYRSKSHTEELEHWFSSLGLYRKFIARNESCIFRAVADTRYLSQSFYHFVHRDLVGYTEKLCPNQFLVYSQQREITKERYLETLKNPLYYKPSPIDLCIISRMYGYNFKLFSIPDEQPVEIKSCIRNQTIMIYTDFESTYDLIYTEERYAMLAFCQHIVYEIYYKHVFKLEDIDYAVKKMLCQEMSPTRLVPGYAHGIDTEGYVPNLNIDKQVMPLNAVYAKRFEMRAKCGNMRRLLEVGITPFPYKVAKALDPDIYRNIEFDVWVEQKRGSRCGLEIWSNSRLVRGVSCIVRFPSGEGATCHIQDVYRESNQVKVYVVKEKQGSMMTVPIGWLEVLGHNQVLVAHRRYLRGSWGEGTARKETEQEKQEVQCGDVSSSGDMDGSKYVTPVITPRQEGSQYVTQGSQYVTPVITPRQEGSQYVTPLITPGQEGSQYVTPVITPRHSGKTKPHVASPPENHIQEPQPQHVPLMMIPPVCYDQVPQHYYPGHMVDWQAPPCYPEVSSPYNVLVDPSLYHGNVDYNYNYQEAPPPGYVQMAPDSLYTPAYSPELPRNTLTPVYPAELTGNTLTPVYPEQHNAMFSPDMNTASPVFFTELPSPAMYSPMYCADPMVPMTADFTMPPPYDGGWQMGEEVDNLYLVPTEMYNQCYYAPMNQIA